MSQLEGMMVGQYRLVEQVGRGGMATVYKAFQASLDRMVAVKILPANFAHDATFLERFRREATSIAKLRHPNILNVYDFGEDNSLTYIVMEYVEGGTLKERLGQPMPLEWSAEIIRQMADALDYAHSQGIVHRDMKPANVLMARDEWALLSDFGIAKIMESSTAGLTGVGVGIGTPEYMSPEQGEGYNVDGRSDIYSLGIMLFQMLTGQLPFTADTPLAVVMKHVTGPLPIPRSLNPSIPEAVERVILKATAKNPADRYQTAGEMAQVLRTAVREPATGTGAATPTLVKGSSLPRSNTMVDAGQAEPAAAGARTVTTQQPVAKSKGSNTLLIVAGIMIAVLCLVAGGAGLVFVVVASNNSSPTSTVVVVSHLNPTPISMKTTSTPPVVSGGTAVPTASSSPGKTPTAASSALPFDLMADNALLEEKYQEALKLAKDAAPDVVLEGITIQVYPFGRERHTNTYWDFYSKQDGMMYYFISFENGPVEESDPEETDPRDVFKELPWRRNANWPALVAEGAKRMGASFTVHPDSVIHIAVEGYTTYDWRANFEDGVTLEDNTYYLKGSQISNRAP